MMYWYLRGTPHCEDTAGREYVNLLQQRQVVRRMVSEFIKFRAYGFKRILLPHIYIKALPIAVQVMRHRGRAIGEDELRILGGRLGAILYPPKMRNSIYYNIVFQPYPLHALALAVLSELPSGNWPELCDVADLGIAPIEFPHPERPVGVVLAIATAFLRTVPREVIVGLGMDYESFITGTTFVAAFAIVLFIGYGAIALYDHGRRKQMEDMYQAVLKYCNATLSAAFSRQRPRLVT